MLKERGFIYQNLHEGWYSISDETFYPPTAVHLVLDPSTGRKYMVEGTPNACSLAAETLYRLLLKLVVRLNGHQKRTTISVYQLSGTAYWNITSRTRILLCLRLA